MPLTHCECTDAQGRGWVPGSSHRDGCNNCTCLEGRLRCTDRLCTPLRCHWSRWSHWSPCSVTCGDGQQTRFRWGRGAGSAWPGTVGREDPSAPCPLLCASTGHLWWAHGTRSAKGSRWRTGAVPWDPAHPCAPRAAGRGGWGTRGCRASASNGQCPREGMWGVRGCSCIACNMAITYPVGTTYPLGVTHPISITHPMGTITSPMGATHPTSALLHGHHLPCRYHPHLWLPIPRASRIP